MDLVSKVGKVREAEGDRSFQVCVRGEGHVRYHVCMCYIQRIEEISWVSEMK